MNNRSGRKSRSLQRLSEEYVKSKDEYGARPRKTDRTRFTDDEIQLLIPAFDPARTTGLSAAEWIASIENLRKLFDWNDRMTQVYAMRRLEGAAQRWFAAHSCNWSQFKLGLLQMFSYPVDKAEDFQKLIRRSKEAGESTERYVFDLERTAMKCGLNVESTINYTILGLTDIDLREHLVACHCKTLAELLYRIRCFKEHLIAKVTSPPSHTSRVQMSEFEKKRATDVSSYPDLMTTVKVQQAFITAFVSFDSHCTTIKHSEFKRHALTMKPCHDKVHIFNSTRVQVIGYLKEMVTAGEVMMYTTVFIVEDSEQMHPMILGRNFLNRPKVCVFKTDRSLQIGYSSSEQADYTAGNKKITIKEEDDTNENRLLERHRVA